MNTVRSAPRYSRLAALLRARIESGELTAGDRLPSEAELCAEYSVSRGTAVRAVSELVTAGIVTRRQGSGSYVASRSLHRRAGRLLSFSETVRLDGHDTRQEVLEYRPARAAEARQFGIGGPAMLLRRLRYVDDTPCAVHSSLIPSAVCRRVAALDPGATGMLDAPHFSLYEQFENSGLGVHEARERVTARLAAPDERALLNVREPAAVIVVLRLSYSEPGDLTEAVEAVYRSDYYTYDAHLVRNPQGLGTGPRLAASSDGFLP